MIKTKSIDFNGRKITVNELTVAQISSWEKDIMAAGTDDTPHILDRLMDRSVPLTAVQLAVPDLTDDDLQVSPTELVALYDAVEEINPFLVKMTERMAQLGQAMFELQKAGKV